MEHKHNSTNPEMFKVLAVNGIRSRRDIQSIDAKQWEGNLSVSLMDSDNNNGLRNSGKDLPLSTSNHSEESIDSIEESIKSIAIDIEQKALETVHLINYEQML